MNNEQMYRQKLLAWYDQTRKHFPKDYQQDLALNELRHFIDTLRPADDESPAGDVLQEKLTWVRPKLSYANLAELFIPPATGSTIPSMPLHAEDLEDDSASQR